jgi:hypothetical protein
MGKTKRAFAAVLITAFLLSCGGGKVMVKQKMATNPSVGVGVHLGWIREDMRVGSGHIDAPKQYRKVGPVLAKLIEEELGIKDVTVIDPLPTKNLNIQVDYSQIKTDVLALIEVRGMYRLNDSTGMYSLGMTGDLTFKDVKTGETIGGFTAGLVLETVTSKERASKDVIDDLVKKIPPRNMVKKFIAAQKLHMKKYLQEIAKSGDK